MLNPGGFHILMPREMLEAMARQAQANAAARTAQNAVKETLDPPTEE